MAKSQKQEVALHKSHEVEVLTGKPEWLTGKPLGNENIEQQDVTLPRIEMCQPLSPCKDRSDPAYIPGITDGELFNTVTRERYGDAVKFVPVAYRRVYLLFRLRTAGGGFRGSFNTAAEAEAARRQQPDPQNYEVVDCGEHVVLLDTSAGLQQAVLAMTKTKHKPSKKLNTVILVSGEERWARVWKLGTVMQKNDKGTFYNFTVDSLGYCNEPTFREALRLHEFIGKTGVRASYDDADVIIDGDGSADM